MTINNACSESKVRPSCGDVSKANESAGAEREYGSGTKASRYMFSLMNIFKIPWKQLIIGCIKTYRRDGIAGLEKLLEIIGSQQAGGNNFSDALLQSGAMLAGQIGYEGIDKLSRYGAGFEKASTAAVRGWFENCPKIIAALGYDWLDELTVIYIKVIKVNPEFGLALLNKSNDIIERAGFDMVYELSRHYELLPAGNAVLIESWIEGCFGMTARAGEGAIEKFARRTSEIFAENPSRAAAFARGETESFSDFMIEIFDGLKLVKIKNVLSVYLEALLGAKLTIVESDSAYTDGIKIFLPSSVTDFQNREMNFTMYKVMATHEEAHIEYGSFDFELGAAAAVYEKVSARYAISYPAEGSDIEKFCGIFPEPSMAGYIFNLFEDFRIESRLISEYPVFGTQIKQINAHFLTKRPSPDSMLCEKERVLEIILQAVLSPSENFSCSGTPARILREILPKAAALRSPSSSVQDSARLTADLYILIDEIPGEPCDQLKSLTSPLNQSVVENNIGNFKRAAREIRRRMNTPSPAGAGAGNGPESVEKKGGGAPGVKKKLTGKGGLEDNIEKLLKSLFKRRGVRPADVESAAKGMADEEFRKYIAGLRSSVAPAEEGEKGSKFFSYPEWGQDIGEYRPNLARVFERECEADKKNDFYAAACKKHRRLIKSVLREFQMLKPSAAGFVNKVDSGDDIDHDPMLEYLIDRKLKKSPSEKIYVRRERNKRDIAVAILLDRSGSTAGKVLECEKESLIIMSEALASLGDDFAIYAYDGHGFECNFGIVKDFGRGYDVEVKRNIGCISPGWATATAAAIRHAAFKLKGREAKTKLIMLLTDGKPTGMTADPIEDTRMALKEAKKQSIQSFCITVDGAAAEYLPRMYGHSSWIVIDDASKLPEKISKIYKRLTN